MTVARGPISDGMDERIRRIERIDSLRAIVLSARAREPAQRADEGPSRTRSWPVVSGSIPIDANPSLRRCAPQGRLCCSFDDTESIRPIRRIRSLPCLRWLPKHSLTSSVTFAVNCRLAGSTAWI